MPNSVLSKALQHQKWVIVCGVIQGITGGYLTIIIYNIIGDFTNDILYRPALITLRSALSLVLALIGSILIIPVMQYIKNIILFRHALEHDRYIMNQFIHLPSDQIGKFKEGEIQYRLERDPNEFRFTVIEVFTKIPVSVIVGAGIFIQLFRINMLYALICLIMSGVPLIGIRITKQLEASYKMKTRDFEMKQRNLEVDMVNGADYIKVFQLGQKFIDLFFHYFEKYYDQQLRRNMRLQYLIQKLNLILRVITDSIIIIFGAWLVAENQIQAGYIMTVIGLSNSLKTVYQDIGTAIKSYHLFQLYIPKLHEISEAAGDSGLIKVPDGPIAIKGDNLGFQYEDNPPLFSNLNFTILPGEKVAIVGPNGRGKSTLLQLMSGLLRPSTGIITINNLNMSRIDLPSYYRQFAYAEQTPYMFDASIYDNVKLGNPFASAEEVIHVLKKTGLHDLSEQNFDVQNSSGGEKQRISVARSLLKNSHLVFLDEPYNDLDDQGKELVRKIILTTGITVIFISHEDELTALADKVIHL
ncbi:ABC transporter ATP-binding protein [Paenibacillus graminis]|uniref:ABC transporter ATP-binding protein n=2 Tax=Paenibacillus graminis TaxID=189425 RepID=UPI002DBB589E|nr:ABC transporter ATP-binding protein [Paenibacillus graminis]MEC0172114.1 ABC transporter ATP-binding protein [Paenibacillus graminis]